ncbi:hypothetical protein ACP4OV_021089 [Aristida adscensionis]
MAGKMKKVREKLHKIANDRDKFSFTASNSSYLQQGSDDRVTSSKVLEADILGRDQEKQKAITLLTKASISSEFVILPIYGIGGIGKTTLAQLLFNDTHFRDYGKAWVYVSQIFDLNKIDESITSQLQMEKSQLNDPHEPDNITRKILIILDDLWESDDFKLDDLKRSLKLIGNGSKVHVIVTTRDASIAQRIQTIEAYKISRLSDDMCWSIIKQIVGFDKRADKGRLEAAGKEIAKKCEGVALAARALGYILRSRNFNGWVSVIDSGIWNISGSGDTPSPYDKVLASLKLSYSSMLPYLRLCFAYCAIFPKGHKVAKNDIIYQWAALGFIKPSDKDSIWQHSENCIQQLLGMSFFQLSDSTLSDGQYDEDATFFTMHDLVHDLARSIMGDEVLDTSDRVCNIGRSKSRYACIKDCSKPLNSFVTCPDNIRALHFLGSDETGNFGAGFSTAKYLRVLDLGECSIQTLPSSIGKLKQLRYLNAPGIKDQKIPTCITQLSKLIYLNLRGSSALLALPKSIGEMENLMYLDLSGCSELGELPESFGNLKNLVHLDFSNCPQVRGVSKFLESLTKLQHLNLRYCHNIGEVPATLARLIKLQYLNISFSSYSGRLSDGNLLGTLTRLEYLDLSSGVTYLQTLPEALGTFTELKYLNLSGLELLEELPRSFGELRNLIHLDLSGCIRATGITEALHSLAELQYLNLSGRCNYHTGDSRLQGLLGVIRKLTELRNLNLAMIQGSKDNMECLLHSISILSNLEHLDLSYIICLDTIPDSILGLRKLHTLKLTGCRNLIRLPKNIGDMDSLKFLILNGCSQLDMSSLRINKSLISLPNFIVHVAEGEQSSNLILLKDVNPLELEISCLENVKSVEEARLIELSEMQNMESLTLDWTRGRKRCVEDMELLAELVPPSTLINFRLQGYNSMSFPIWLMNIAFYLPSLVRVKLAGLSQCSTLPPLGQLPNLKHLHIEAMPNIKKIDGGFCGGLEAFTQLVDLCIFNMDSLEEWIVADPYAEDAADEFMFPKLKFLTIHGCHKLTLNPCPPRVKGFWHIVHSDDVLLEWGEGAPHTSAVVASLWVEPFMAPMHQWKLLHNLSALDELIIEDCFDLSIPPEIIGALSSLRKLALQSCRRMVSLPQWLRHLSSLQSLSLISCSSIQELPVWLSDLVSLKKLSINSCASISSLPESIQHMANLKSLNIYGCPTLQQWCQLEVNELKIDQIIKQLDSPMRSIPNDILHPWGIQNQGHGAWSGTGEAPRRKRVAFKEEDSVLYI